ncbi:MAG: hypothetical protein FWF01_00575 [Alphaproteobacteria bacterium]|nr:hypothetical protein [Alphaproteobacteria bacterium]
MKPTRKAIKRWKVFFDGLPEETGLSKQHKELLVHILRPSRRPGEDPLDNFTPSLRKHMGGRLLAYCPKINGSFSLFDFDDGSIISYHCPGDYTFNYSGDKGERFVFINKKAGVAIKRLDKEGVSIADSSNDDFIVTRHPGPEGRLRHIVDANQQIALEYDKRGNMVALVAPKLDDPIFYGPNAADIEIGYYDRIMISSPRIESIAGPGFKVFYDKFRGGFVTTYDYDGGNGAGNGQQARHEGGQQAGKGWASSGMSGAAAQKPAGKQQLPADNTRKT